MFTDLFTDKATLEREMSALEEEPTDDACCKVETAARDLRVTLRQCVEEFGFDDAEVLRQIPETMRKSADLVEAFNASKNSPLLAKQVENIRRHGDLAECIRTGNMEKFREICDGPIQKAFDAWEREEILDKFAKEAQVYASPACAGDPYRDTPAPSELII